MEQNNNLNLNDLKNILIIIDYAADSGTFKGWSNIRKVMELRDKLENFIKNSENNENKNSVSEKNKNQQKDPKSKHDKQKKIK